MIFRVGCEALTALKRNYSEFRHLNQNPFHIEDLREIPHNQTLGDPGVNQDWLLPLPFNKRTYMDATFA